MLHTPPSLIPPSSLGRSSGSGLCPYSIVGTPDYSHGEGVPNNYEEKVPRGEGGCSEQLGATTRRKCSAETGTLHTYSTRVLRIPYKVFAHLLRAPHSCSMFMGFMFISCCAQGLRQVLRVTTTVEYYVPSVEEGTTSCLMFVQLHQSQM